MADILKIGLSGLLAQQRALTATSNNVANAATPGYSRQRVELIERPGERFGSGFIGAGVDTLAVRRITDDLLAAQARSAAANFERSAAFSGLAAALDNLLADENTGLHATLQAFRNAVQDVANDPASISSRQVLLSEARNVAARFRSISDRLDQVEREIAGKLRAATAEITSLGQGIAELNREIVKHGASSSPPPDLLDQRDRLLGDLAKLVNVETVPQQDGSVSVFIGSGQVLVLGASAATLSVVPSAFDPTQPEIVVQGPSGSAAITQFLTGGEIGGMLDFRREMLEPARAGIGRVAIGLAAAVNAEHRNGMDLTGALGGDLLSVAAPRTFPAATNGGSGTLAATIGDIGALEPASYRVVYDGSTYRMFREDTGAEVPLTGTGTALDPFRGDGLELVVGGAPAAGDQFLVRPCDAAAGSLQVLVTNPAKIAAAAPIRTAAAPGNVGDGAISAGEVVDVGDPNLLATATIEFLDATTYSIDGAGSFAYVPGEDIVVHGARVRITGAPVAGDRFVIEANQGGVGDNRNALAIAAALGGGLLDGGTASLEAAVGRVVTDVGALTAEARNRADAQQLLRDQAAQNLEAVRGVNLDEEAANMLRYQQLYQAAAQTIAVSETLFATLMAAIGR